MAIIKPTQTVKTKIKKPKLPMPMPAAPTAPSKTFGVKSYSDVKRGEKIVLYGDTGIGKSSLALLAPKPVFLDLDEGAFELHHPVTGNKVDYVPDVVDFSDVRAALQEVSLYDNHETVVVDNATILQDWAEPHVVATIKTEKGATVANLVAYGYNKGYKHLYNEMKGPLADCDELIRRGKNVIIIAQAALRSVPNPSGEDFLRSGLRLHIDKSWNIEALYCEWASHVLRIDYLGAFVSKTKKISGATTRAVFVQPELHFRAKSRSIHEPVISFADASDDSLWQFMFQGGE